MHHFPGRENITESCENPFSQLSFAGGLFAPNRAGAALAAAHLSLWDRERDDRKGRPYAGGIFVYKNTFTLLTNVRVVWYNILNQIKPLKRR